MQKSAKVTPALKAPDEGVSHINTFMERRSIQNILKLLIIPTLIFTVNISYDSIFTDEAYYVKTTAIHKNKEGDKYLLLVDGAVRRTEQSIPKSIFDIINAGDTVNIVEGKLSGGWQYITVLRDGAILVDGEHINSNSVLASVLLLFIALLAFLPEKWFFHIESLTPPGFSLIGIIAAFSAASIFAVFMSIFL